MPAVGNPSEALRTWTQSRNPRRMAVIAFLPLVDDDLRTRVLDGKRLPLWEEVHRALSYVAYWGVEDPIYGVDVLELAAMLQGFDGEQTPTVEPGARYDKLAVTLVQLARNAG